MEKIILITGSDSGIGRYMAKKFLEDGNIVIITGYQECHIEETKNELIKYKDRTTYIQVDVTNEKSIINMLDISPSLTLTPLALKSYTEEEIEEVSKKSLRKRLCNMEDIYNLSKFLISEKADYINGENININGGILLR